MEKKENVKEKVKKVREIFLDDLPKYNSGASRGRINWIQSSKCKVKFDYEGTKGEVEIVDYDPKEQYLYIKYQDNDIFRIHTSSFIKCKLGKLLGKHTNEFKVKLGIFKDNKRDLTIIDREYRLEYDINNKKCNYKWYEYTCNKCGYEGWIVEGHLLSGKGCACCANKVIIEGINDIPTTAPWMIKYFQGGYEEAKLYTRGSDKKIVPICPDCGRVKDKGMKLNDIYVTKSIGCKKCGDGISYPEKFMFNLLEQLNIEFITEYRPKWCKYELKGKLKQGRYDFYFILNDKKYIVEMDGLFHKKDNSMNGLTKEESKFIDDYKDTLAEKHGIEKPIRIDCDESDMEYIKEKTLKSKLNDLFDLNQIDWLKVEEYALKNLVKVVCELKRNNPDLTTTEIMKLVNLKQSSIINYLKKGSTLGWCNYNAKEEKLKASSKSGKMRSKAVEVFKDGISVGIFSSCVELEKKSEEIFGFKLLQCSMSEVRLGKRDCYKGFVFKYI